MLLLVVSRRCCRGGGGSVNGSHLRSVLLFCCFPFFLLLPTTQASEGRPKKRPFGVVRACQSKRERERARPELRRQRHRAGVSLGQSGLRTCSPKANRLAKSPNRSVASSEKENKVSATDKIKRAKESAHLMRPNRTGSMKRADCSLLFACLLHARTVNTLASLREITVTRDN